VFVGSVKLQFISVLYHRATVIAVKRIWYHMGVRVQVCSTQAMHFAFLRSENWKKSDSDRVRFSDLIRILHI
jgi:hypothetical protein